MRALSTVAGIVSLAIAVVGLSSSDARGSSTGMTTTTCAPLDAFAVKALRDAVKHEYRPSYAGCTLAIDVAACGAPAGANEIVYLSGAGHSWSTSLEITSLRRDGSAWQVTRLVLTKGASTIAKWAGEKSDGVKVLRGTIDGAAIETATSIAQVAHAFLLRELPKPSPTGLTFGGGWMSSADFATSITLLAPGMIVDRSFVGYSSSDTQLDSLPLTVASARLDAAIPEAALSPSTLDSSARALFLAETMRRAGDLDEQFHWWVREALVRAAGDAGDPSLVPILARYLAKPADPSSGERTRIAAISALSALVGVDKRFDTNGVERPVDVVAHEYAKMLTSKPTL